VRALKAEKCALCAYVDHHAVNRHFARVAPAGQAVDIAVCRSIKRLCNWFSSAKYDNFRPIIFVLSLNYFCLVT